MSQSWIEIDGVSERELPAHAADGRSGDRVSLLDAGLLHVCGARATFVPWGQLLAVIEHAGQVYVLVPRRPPGQPWVAVTRAMVGPGADSLRTFKDRLEARAGGQDGGYRDAVRRRRQNLSPDALREKVMAREAVPGALEVPSTIMLGVSYPGLAFAQLAIITAGGVVGFTAHLAVAIAMAGARADPGMIGVLGPALMIGFILGGAWAAFEVGRRWREAKNRTLPRQRVLVLAPDGCIAGLRTGVRTLAWPDVGAFAVGHDPDTYDEALVVRGASGETLGTIQSAWLDAPLDLVVCVAQAYRAAALTDG